MSVRERGLEWKGRIARQKKTRVWLLVALVLVAAAAVWYFFIRPGPEVEAIEASGTVEATQADVGFKTAGRIEEILVDEGDVVAGAEEVALLDRAEILAQRGAARGRLAEAQARLEDLLAGTRPEEIEEARAAVEAEAEGARQAAREAARTAQLLEAGAVSREEAEQAGTAADVARAQLAQARARLERLEAGPTEQEIAAERAVVEQARAQVEEVEAALEQTVLITPFGGVITVRHRTEGEIVAPGQPVVTVMDYGDRWVRIYVPEDQIGRVYLGQAAWITSDTYEDRVYPGVVSFIADVAEFTPRNVQTKEERVKLVFAVEVQILEDPDMDLKPGIPADVVLEPREAPEPRQVREPRDAREPADAREPEGAREPGDAREPGKAGTGGTTGNAGTAGEARER